MSFFRDDVVSFRETETLYLEYKEKCLKQKIPWDTFIKVNVSHIILACVADDMTNQDFMMFMEDMWHQLAPILAQEIKKRNAIS